MSPPAARQGRLAVIQRDSTSLKRVKNTFKKRGDGLEKWGEAKPWQPVLEVKRFCFRGMGGLCSERKILHTVVEYLKLEFF